MRIGQERFARQVECSDGLFALHRGELAQKFVERVAAL
jgi:hypothetical protein